MQVGIANEKNQGKVIHGKVIVSQTLIASRQITLPAQNHKPRWGVIQLLRV